LTNNERLGLSCSLPEGSMLFLGVIAKGAVKLTWLAVQTRIKYNVINNVSILKTKVLRKISIDIAA
jgi:hypothetical protein